MIAAESAPKAPMPAPTRLTCDRSTASPPRTEPEATA